MTKDYFEDGQCYCTVCFVNSKGQSWCTCLAHGPWPCGHCQDHIEYQKFFQSLGLIAFPGKGPRVKRPSEEPVGLVGTEGYAQKSSLGPPDTIANRKPEGKECDQSSLGKTT